MSLNNVKYDAFISYRHSEKDKAVAMQLQRKLESFRLPKGVTSKSGKTHIERVFRDQDELPLSSNLADPITEALRNSEYLIVICSPRLPQSEWCLKEIETFKEMHGLDHILAVLIEGEPEDSFPEPLLHSTVQVLDERGNVSLRTVNVEPLAADVRSKSRSELKKAIDDAVLRISAPIFGLNYDDLKQRERERRIRHMMTFWGSVGAAVTLFAIVSSVLLVKITRQNNMIAEQYDEINKQNEDILQKQQEILYQSYEIKQQKETLEELYQKAAVENANLMAGVSAGLLSDGRRMDAIYAIRSVLPETRANSETYSPAAHLALSEALHPYSYGRDLLPTATLDVEGGISEYSSSPSLQYVAVLNKFHALSVFNTDTGERLALPTFLTDTYWNTVCFVSDNDLLLVGTQGLCLYRLNSASVTTLDSRSPEEIYYDGSSDKYLLVFHNSLEVRSVSDHSIVMPFNFPGTSGRFDGTITPDVSDDNRYLSFACKSTLGEEDSAYAIVLDTVQKQVAYMKEFHNLTIGALPISSGRLYFNWYTKFTITSQFVCHIECIDLESGQQLFAIENDILTHSTYLDEANRIMTMVGSNEVRSYNMDTGERLGHITLPSSVLECFHPLKEPYLYIFCKDGSVLLYNCCTYAAIFYTEYIFAFLPGKSMQAVDFSINKAVIQFQNEDYFSVYRRVANNERERLCDLPDVSGLLVYSTDGARVLRLSPAEDRTYLYNLISGTSLLLDDAYSEYYFVENLEEYLIAVGPDGLYRIDAATGETLDYLSNPDNSNGFWRPASPGNRYFWYQSNGSYMLYDVETLSLSHTTSDNPIGLQISDADNLFAVLTDDSVDLHLFNSLDEAYGSIPLSRHLVDHLLFSSDGKYLFIAFTGGYVEVYDVSTLQLAKRIYNLTVSKTTTVYYYENAKIYVMSDHDNLYVLTDSLDVITKVSDGFHYRSIDNSFYIITGNYAFRLPYYSYEALIQKADNALQNYKVSSYYERKLGID